MFSDYSLFQRAVDADAWYKLENEGILTDNLISYMWRDLIGSGKDSEQMVGFIESQVNVNL